METKLNTNDARQTARLISAAGRGDLELVKHTLENRADKNGIDANGNTAFIAASLKGHASVMAFLLEQGVDKSIQNKKGQSASRAFLNSVLVGTVKVGDLFKMEREYPIIAKWLVE